VGVDLDGFLWARRRRRGPFVVMLKGIIADELRNERGWVRGLLSVQARWERSNTACADRVVVPSRYSASVAHEVYGIPDARAVLLGEVTRRTLAVEYMRAHCFCLPTVQEGFGLVFAEAMAAGLPVVACHAAAVPEIVEDRHTGFLVSPRSPDELASALETLLMNEKLREDFGRAAAQRVEAFGLPRVARRFLETLP